MKSRKERLHKEFIEEVLFNLLFNYKSKNDMIR